MLRFTLLLLFLPFFLFAQQNVAINTDGSTPDPSAILDIKSTNRGVLLPRSDTSTVNAATTPVPGLIIYQTSDASLYCYDGAAWTKINSDDLGNHEATQNLQLKDKWLNNDGDNEGIMISNSGEVGIGFSIPESELDLNGDLILRDGTGRISFYKSAVEKASLYFDGKNMELKNEELGGDLYFEAIDDIFLQGGGITSMTINDAQNVGIGTTTPSTKLQIIGGSDASLADGGYLTIGSAGGSNILLDNNEILARNNGAASPLYLQAEGGDFRINFSLPEINEFMVKSDGKTGIGDFNPTDKLHINSDVGENAFRVQVQGSTKFRIYENGSISMGANQSSLAVNTVSIASSYNLGLGESSPVEKLDVDGAIKIGDSDAITPSSGTIRWNPSTDDFEGYNGEEWLSLTQQRNIWGAIKSSPNQKIKASDAAADDGFGRPAISGNTAIIGAKGEGVGGSAYIFEYNGTIWEQKAKLTYTSPSVDDYFGFSVAISDDVAIVGAYEEDSGSSNAGSAYIYVKPASGWANMTQTANLNAASPITDEYFGYSVAIAGDVAIVGAPNDNSGANNTGSAYIFKKPGSGWVNTTETAKLTSSSPNEDDHLGISVSISGDVAIAGAYGDEIGGLSIGSVHVYQRPIPGWSDMTQTGILSVSEPVAGGLLGVSVSISGDVIVGGMPNNNKAFIFEKPISGWSDMTQTAEIMASDGSGGELFGWSVSIYNKDIVVGAWLQEEGGTSSGACYVFQKPPGGWTDMTENSRLKTSAPQTGTILGYSVAISENFIMSYAADNDIASDSGACYFFKR